LYLTSYAKFRKSQVPMLHGPAAFATLSNAWLPPN
jgi:hypothetical protein